jgi:hypothetical protein
MKLLGCRVSNRLFKTWSKALVHPVGPYFLTKSMQKHFSSRILLTRSEFQSTFRNLSFHDSYATYAIIPEAPWVTLLSSEAFLALPKELHLELHQLQAKLGRGQIYNFDDYKALLQPSELELTHSHTFDYQGLLRLDLSYPLWHSFSFETQKRWLATFISEDRNDCLSGQLSKRQWRQINKRFPAIQHVLGFPGNSGPNCFATVLAALYERDLAKHISSLWLQRETFLREIKKQGYQKSLLRITEHLPESSILIWHNNTHIQHTCLYLGDGLVFNKDAQSWSAPRQILKLETVLKTWSEDKLDVQVYSLS